MTRLIFFILIAPVLSMADGLKGQIFYQETEHLYQGYEAVLDYSKVVELGKINQLRFGLSALSGEYVSGVSQENKVFSAGFMAKFEKSYSDFEAEVAENDNRKPFSKIRYEHFIPWASNEIQIGFVHSAFSNENSKVVVLGLAHFLNDEDFYSGAVFTDVDHSDLVSYRIMLRKFLVPKWDLRFYLAGGKEQQDIGVTQKFSAASALILYGLNESKRLGLTLSKSWGELLTDSTAGISYLCQF